jgi:Pectate lyase superfamily protein
MNPKTVAATAALIACLSGCGQSQSVSANSTATVNSTFDTAAIQTAVNNGGVITFAPGKYLIDSTIMIRKSGTVIQGSGRDTVFIFKPTLPQVSCVNDRAFSTPCDVISTIRRPIESPIAVGDTSFTTASDISDLRKGDWLIVDEDDSTLGGVPVTVDWAQVSDVSLNTLTFSTPFRTAFSTARQFSESNRVGLGFYKLPELIENVEFRDFSVLVPDSGAGAPGISVFAAKDTIIYNVEVQDENGQALYSYISKGLRITNSSGDSGKLLSEFGATVDLTLENDVFISQQSAALGLDLGCAFFDISNISIPRSTNIGAYMIIGIHDGRFHDSSISFVASAGDAVGILARGTQRITITGNALAGGAGNSIGISVGPQLQGVDIPIPSVGNVLTPNSFGTQWMFDYD